VTGTVGTFLWVFGAGPAGGITITGGMSTPSLPAGSTLLTGQIESATVTASSGDFKVAISSFVNSINPTLAAFFGVSATGWSGDFNLGFEASGAAPSRFTSSSVSSGDVITSAPEPTGLALGAIGLGSMLFAVHVQRRKARLA
jgi:hypothetical protein